MCNTTQDNKSLYDRQKERIGVKADAFIGYLVKRGLLGDKNIDDEKIRTAKQEKRKNAYHNTLLLLKNYRTIAWMMECFPTAVAEELDRPFEGLDELLEQVDLEISLDNRKLQNRMAGMQKSRRNKNSRGFRRSPMTANACTISSIRPTYLPHS